jgi:hypothetical protein
MGKKVKKQTQSGIDAVLAAINKDERFTAGKYNILRLVAAYPLDADFEARGEKVAKVLEEDNHALALMRRSTLASILATENQVPSVLSSLAVALNMARDGDNRDGMTNVPQS